VVLTVEPYLQLTSFLILWGMFFYVLDPAGIIYVEIDLLFHD
jgi:hypothetical protein